MASSNHTVVVSVLGLSRLDGEDFGSHKGIGKSCLCSRFMYPGYDDYQHDSHSHCSLLALDEFESDVVHKDPFLYWGSTTKIYDAKGSSEKVHFEVLEYTVFYQDITDRPFRINSSKKSFPSLNDYLKVALAKPLISPGKLSYKSRDLICAPQDYESVAFPSRIAKRKRGFLVVIDVSDNGPTFDSRLHQTEKIVAHLASMEQKFVVAATKTDEAFATSLEKLSELARKRKFTLIEVSAKANVNVSEAFEIVAGKVLHKSKTINGLPPTQALSYSDAANKTLSTLDHAKRSFRTYLQKRVMVSSEGLKTLELTEEYKTCAHLHGKFETNKMFAHHVLTLRNDEVSTYAGVMDNEEMRQKFLEDYLAERKDLSPHENYLKELIINICQMCSRRASESETPKNELNFTPSSLTMQQDSKEGNYRPLPLVPYVDIPTQELDKDVWYAKFSDNPTDVCPSECNEVGTDKGQGEADNHSYVSVRMNNEIAWSDSDNDEYVIIAGTEWYYENLDMVRQTTQPTAPLQQSFPQLHQPPAQLQPLSAELHQPLSEMQEPHNPHASLQQLCLQLLQPTQGNYEEEGKHEQPILTQGTPITLLDKTIVGPGTSSLSRLGGADELGGEDSLTSQSSQPKKSPPQVLKEKPLPLPTWTVSLVQPDTIITSPDNGRSANGGESDEVKNPVGCSTISKSIAEKGDNMTTAFELGASRAIPVLATAPTVVFPCTTPVGANNTVGRKVETPHLDRIKEKLKKGKKVGSLREIQLDSSMSPLPWNGPDIPAGEIHDTTGNQGDDDFALCKKCGISWVPLEKSCLSEVKPHPLCQICALSDLMSNNDAEREEDGRYDVISNNPMDMCPHVSNKEGAKEGQDDEDDGSYLYMLNISCVENDIAGSYSDEYVAITRMGVEDHDYVNTSEILGPDLESVDTSPRLFAAGH